LSFFPLCCADSNEQVSVALETGAAGVYLLANVVSIDCGGTGKFSNTPDRFTGTQLGSKLDEMLHMCTVMGTEAVVEVHTRKELELAIASVAPIIMVRENENNAPNICLFIYRRVRRSTTGTVSMVSCIPSKLCC
jgi:hypothetical protein